MAGNLGNLWARHALPEDAPAREQAWAELAEAQRESDRTDIYHELSGGGMKMHRFTSEDDSRIRRDGKDKEKGTYDAAVMASAADHYQWAYNTELTFTIDGQDYEISQGRLHELATERAEELRRQIEEAKQRGASPEEIALLEQERHQTIIVRDNTDPDDGPINHDSDRQQTVRDALGQAPGLRDRMTNKEPTFDHRHSPGSQEDDAASGIENDKAASQEAVQRLVADGISAANAVQDDPFAEVAASPTDEFAVAAADASDLPATPAVEPDEPNQDVPRQNSGFSPG